MKTYITLDPDYIPWAPTAPEVKLRHKHNKVMAFLLPIVVTVAVFGALWVYVNRGTLSQGNERPMMGAATSVGVMEASERAPMTSIEVAAPAMGRLGMLTLRANGGDVFLDCPYYRVLKDMEWFTGNTLTITNVVINSELVRVYGAMVDVRNAEKVEVRCAVE